MPPTIPQDGTRDGDGVWMGGKWHPDMPLEELWLYKGRWYPWTDYLQQTEGALVITDRDKEINSALAYADMLEGSGNVSHHFKVLAQAVRTLRRENAKLATASTKYQEGWDDASRQYQATAAKVNSGDADQELIEALRAQHNAMDTLMAKLIILTSRHTPEEVFYPSKSGIIWDAMTRAHAIIERASRQG